MSFNAAHNTGKTTKKMNDVLFNAIEDMQIKSGKPFGKFLDAGTGVHSLRWIATLIPNSDDFLLDQSSGAIDHDEALRASVTSFTAVTADEEMRSNVRIEAAKLGIPENVGHIVIGNWKQDMSVDDAESAEEVAASTDYLCHNETYDTILADYLIGAMDGFSPYYQDQIFDRLKKHLKPGGRIYVVGLQPIPDRVEGAANIFCRVTKLRDACILLAGHRCYREYPQDWIERHMAKAGLKVVGTSTHPILYTHKAIVRQLNVARSKLSYFPSQGLADQMREAIDALEKESRDATDKSPTGRLKLGFDYIVCGELSEEEGDEVEEKEE
mmetsp:Transcript_11369/g.17237  ORF Transcript_11369/g.17237 Transcript_11369/m.17237 type:complete len:326 (-) Transcript_11369:104-1081(-)